MSSSPAREGRGFHLETPDQEGEQKQRHLNDSSKKGNGTQWCQHRRHQTSWARVFLGPTASAISHLARAHLWNNSQPSTPKAIPWCAERNWRSCRQSKHKLEMHDKHKILQTWKTTPRQRLREVEHNKGKLLSWFDMNRKGGERWQWWVWSMQPRQTTRRTHG
jgi:hypothetical protein